MTCHKRAPSGASGTATGPIADQSHVPAYDMIYVFMYIRVYVVYVYVSPAVPFTHIHGVVAPWQILSPPAVRRVHDTPMCVGTPLPWRALQVPACSPRALPPTRHDTSGRTPAVLLVFVVHEQRQLSPRGMHLLQLRTPPSLRTVTGSPPTSSHVDCRHLLRCLLTTSDCLPRSSSALLVVSVPCVAGLRGHDEHGGRGDLQVLLAAMDYHISGSGGSGALSRRAEERHVGRDGGVGDGFAGWVSRLQAGPSKRRDRVPRVTAVA